MEATCSIFTKKIKTLSARPPWIFMQQCKCMDVYHSGERMLSGPMKGATRYIGSIDMYNYIIIIYAVVTPLLAL